MGRGPVGLAHNNARAAVGFACVPPRHTACDGTHAAPASPPPLAGEGQGGGTQRDSCWPPPPQPSPASGRGERTEIAGTSGESWHLHPLIPAHSASKTRVNGFCWESRGRDP